MSECGQCGGQATQAHATQHDDVAICTTCRSHLTRVLFLFYINKYFYNTFHTDVESIVIRLILKIDDGHLNSRIPLKSLFLLMGTT